MSPQRKAAREEPSTKDILLKAFPTLLHRQMRAAAVQQGRRVTEGYAEACTLFLRITRKKKGGEVS